MRVRSKWLAGLIGAGGWGAAVAALAMDCPTPLRVGFMDVEVGSYVHGSGEAFASPPGSLVVETQRILREMGCTFSLVRRPLRRLHLELQTGQLDLAVGLSPTAELLSLARFPLDAQGHVDPRWALGETRAAWFTLRSHEHAAADLLSPAQRAAARVGVIRGSAQLPMAQRLGFNVTELTDLPRALAMLTAGRLDAVLLPSIAVPRDHYPDLVELPHAVATQTFYLPASRRFASDHPLLTREIWRRFCQYGRTEFPSLPSCPAAEVTP